MGSRTTNWKLRAGIVGAAALGLALVSCTSVMESTILDYAVNASPGVPTSCHTSLGGYSLPKTFIKIQIAKLKRTAPSERFEYALHTLESVRRADNNQVFCLDYLASALSDDQVMVQKKRSSNIQSSQLLQVVASRAYDQTSYIIRRIIRTIFIGIGNFGVRSLDAGDLKVAEPMADLEFDPFDVRKMADINDQVRQYGFCIILEGFSFNPKIGSAEHYCRDPQALVRIDPYFAEIYPKFEAAPVELRSPGIVYRPRAQFQLLIYTKVDPRGREPWRLRKSQPISLENVSPVIAIRVDRATFAKKKIALIFDDGMLKDACIFKSSELTQAIEIPLEIVKSIVRLPTEIAQVKYDQISESEKLLDAEKVLLTKLQTYTTTLNEKTTTNQGTISDTPLAYPTAQTYPGDAIVTSLLNAKFPQDDIASLKSCPDTATVGARQ